MRSKQEHWLAKFRKLNPNVSRAKGEGNARFTPHKPLLLLCLIEIAESGALVVPVVDKSPELRLRFDCYWGIVQGRWGGRPGFDLPFHYLSSQGFWTPLRRMVSGAGRNRPRRGFGWRTTSSNQRSQA